MPPQTVLRGQGEELARLIWTNRWDQRLDAVIVGASRFGIEDSEPGDGPWVEDVVIEGNTIAQTNIGIELGPRCAGIVVRNNVLQDVEHPFLGEGLKAARLEGNQVPRPDEKDKTKKMR